MTKIDLVYQSDDNYAMLTGISLVSLFENNKDIDKIKVHILNDNISKKNLENLKETCKNFNREIDIIETSKVLEELKSLKVEPYFGKYTTYFRLMSLNLIKPISNRILSIDGDTIIKNSIKELCSISLKNKICGGVCDCILNDHKQYINIPYNDRYYNGGVLLFDFNKWIKQNCKEKIIKFLKNKRNKFYLGDQDIFNSLFRNECLCLNVKYNFNSGFYIYGIKESLKLYDLKPSYYYTEKEIQEAYKDPVIIHCMGTVTARPWEKNNIHPQREEFNKYKKMSLWKNIEDKESNQKLLFKVQRLLYKILPMYLYVLIHKFVLKKYIFKKNIAVKK